MILKNKFVIGGLIIAMASAAVGVNFGLRDDDERFRDGWFTHTDSNTLNQREQNMVPFYLMPFEDTEFSKGSPFRLGMMVSENDPDGTTWAISKESLPNYMAGINGEKAIKVLGEDVMDLENGQWMKYFGSFNIWMPTEDGTFGQSLYTVRHNQYVVGKNADGNPALGVRALPIDDQDPTVAEEILDPFLRAKMGIEKTDKIFAPIYYFHGEYYEGHIKELDKKHRTDDGFTHMGAYIGQGATRNAPYSYHGKQWQIDGSYPANMVMVKYDGAKSQAAFNNNAYLALKLLNETGPNVIFSRLNYEQDYYEANNLKSVLDFYRAWLDADWVRPGETEKDEDGNLKPFRQIIRDKKLYDTYCAEHITMVLNLALNLEQNEKGYIETFGSDADQANLGQEKQLNDQLKGGEWFWKMAKQVWEEEVGEDMPVIAEGSVTPLWKLDKTSSDKIKKKIWSANGKVIKGGATLVNYPGYGMAWAPLTLPGMVRQYMALYGRWDKMDPKIAIGTLMAFEEAVRGRAPTMSKEQYANATAPFIEDITTSAQALGVLKAQLDSGDISKKVFSDKAKSLSNKFLGDVRGKLEKLRDPKNFNLNTQSTDFWYYSPPPIIQRILQGNHRHNELVNFEVLGTAFDKSDLIKVDNQVIDEGTLQIKKGADNNTVIIETEDGPEGIQEIVDADNDQGQPMGPDADSTDKGEI